MSAQHALLALGDLSGMSEDQIKQHIADNYAGTESGFSYGTPSDEEYRRAAFNPVERRQRAKCEECDGLGVWGQNSEHREVECPACDGTGVEP